MSNLYNQNIGTNYKSILNLDATTINTPLDATLRAVTDGMGTASPLQLSTEQVGLSRTVALSAGATNPRLFNEVYTINNSGAQTGTLTGFFLNATETALNGITHNLMDLQVGGVSKFKIGSSGAVTAVGTIGLFTFNSYFYFASTGGSLTSAGCYEGSTAFSINGGSTYLLRLSASSVEKLTINNVGTIAWGTTSSFPAIKRNSAGIDFRLADDSAYCAINALTASFKTTNANANGTLTFINNSATTIASLTDSGSALTLLQFRADGINFTDLGTKGIVIQSSGYATNANASSILDVISTSKGFLPPRMTTAQVNAIATPAEGLVVFNTTISHLCVYQAAAWVKLSHSPM